MEVLERVKALKDRYQFDKALDELISIQNLIYFSIKPLSLFNTSSFFIFIPHLNYILN